MAPTGNTSPTNVDAELKYITVEEYAWPKSEPVRRSRLDREESKRRHREGQREFMARKRSRIKILRREVALLDLQQRYMRALQDEKTLTKERRHLQRQNQMPRSASAPESNVRFPIARNNTETFTGPADSDVMDSGDMDKLLMEVLLAW